MRRRASEGHPPSPYNAGPQAAIVPGAGRVNSSCVCPRPGANNSGRRCGHRSRPLADQRLDPTRVVCSPRVANLQLCMPRRSTGAGRVNGMLPDLRFVIGAIFATAMLGIVAIGLFATVRMTHQAKMGPLEISRNVTFDDRADWNQFSDPDSVRRFEELTRRSAPAEASTLRAATAPAIEQSSIPAADAPTVLAVPAADLAADLVADLAAYLVPDAPAVAPPQPAAAAKRPRWRRRSPPQPTRRPRLRWHHPRLPQLPRRRRMSRRSRRWCPSPRRAN